MFSGDAAISVNNSWITPFIFVQSVCDRPASNRDSEAEKLTAGKDKCKKELKNKRIHREAAQSSKKKKKKADNEQAKIQKPTQNLTKNETSETQVRSFHM